MDLVWCLAVYLCINVHTHTDTWADTQFSNRVNSTHWQHLSISTGQNKKVEQKPAKNLIGSTPNTHTHMIVPLCAVIMAAELGQAVRAHICPG